MSIQQNVGLAAYSTMGLGGQASYLAVVTHHHEIPQLVTWAKQEGLPVIMIGGGSNIFWRDEGFDGLVLVNKLSGYQTRSLENDRVSLTIGAGENWDEVVARSVDSGLTGIEALSLIPGTAGATPIQNVGAYGQEISQTLTVVEAWDNQTEQFVNIPGDKCGFTYRNSRFKNTDRGRFFITSIRLHLLRGNPQPPFYGSVQAYFDKHHITSITPADLRRAVIEIRTSKLPDPKVVRNNGSFFANPIVSEAEFARLLQSYPELPHWAAGEGQIKLSAAWLIEQAGFKNYDDPDTGISTWPKQPLVLVNKNAKGTKDLLKFKQKILEVVKHRFGLELIQEPELLP